MNEYVNVYRQSFRDELKKIEGFNVFADESMNLRKVKLTQEVNEKLKHKFFVIGGVIVPNRVDLKEIRYLYDKREGYPNGEVKYNFFAHNEGKIEKAIKHDRFYRLFNFLLKNNVYIHLNINSYWYLSLADIVDSLFAEDNYNYYLATEFKMALYEIMMLHYEEMYKLLYEHNYPSISKNKINSFINGLYKIVEKSANENIREGDDIYNGVVGLKTLLSKKIDKIKELVFIQYEEPLLLYDSLLPVYMQTCVAFMKNGIHFDNEIIIDQKMDEISPEIKRDLKLDFVDSKDNIGVQISDVIAGFTARLYEMLVNEIRFGNFLETVKTGSVELKTIILFKELLFKSIDFYKLNYIRIMSVHEDNSIIRIMSVLEQFS